MKISNSHNKFLHLPTMEGILGLIILISSFFFKGKLSVILLYFGLGLTLAYISFMLRDEVKKRKEKKKDPLKTACAEALMVPDKIRGEGYKCDYCEFPAKPCPNKIDSN